MCNKSVKVLCHGLRKVNSRKDLLKSLEENKLQLLPNHCFFLSSYSFEIEKGPCFIFGARSFKNKRAWLALKFLFRLVLATYFLQFQPSLVAASAAQGAWSKGVLNAESSYHWHRTLGFKVVVTCYWCVCKVVSSERLHRLCSNLSSLCSNKQRGASGSSSRSINTEFYNRIKGHEFGTYLAAPL